MQPAADIGIIGMGVMGRNLALNLADHDYQVAIYNRTQARTEEVISGPGPVHNLIATANLEAFTQVLKPPKKIMLMVAAGKPVDALIQDLLPFLSANDILIDGGNSLYTDTTRRTQELDKQGLIFIGAGISGGEEGARYGPSIMPGGNEAGWKHIQPLLTDIAAKAPDGDPCCNWLGPDGAGHFVKMVHNGIEYGDMQIIAETYQLLRAKGLTAEAMSQVFSDWNQQRLESFLIEITSQILKVTDDDGSLLLDRILDAAGQKGTGRWTVTASMDHPTPLTLVAEAVYARMVSSLVEQRHRAAQLLHGPEIHTISDAELSIVDLEQALYAAKVISYTQGFMLLASASEQSQWGISLHKVAALWRAGCIIRAAFLEDIMTAFSDEQKVDNLLVHPLFTTAINHSQSGLRKVVAVATQNGLPVPALSAALSFYDSIRCHSLPTNLIQAQRDFFGAHQYERVDHPRGQMFHSDWTSNQA